MDKAHQMEQMTEQRHLQQAGITDYGFKAVGYDWSLPVMGYSRPGRHAGGGRGGCCRDFKGGGGGMAGAARWVRTRMSWGGRAGARVWGEGRALETLEAGGGIRRVAPHHHAVRFQSDPPGYGRMCGRTGSGGPADARITDAERPGAGTARQDGQRWSKRRRQLPMVPPPMMMMMMMCLPPARLAHDGRHLTGGQPLT